MCPSKLDLGGSPINLQRCLTVFVLLVGSVSPYSFGDRLLDSETLKSVVNAPVFSTFLGGSDEDCVSGCQVAVDDLGSIYIAGMTESTDFPTTPGAYDEGPAASRDVFVAKLSADGSSFEYVTLIGGSLDDWAVAIAVDDAGCAYITGGTSSDNFPTTPGAFDVTHNSGYYPDDAFVVKLNADGSALLYATYLGSGSTDQGAAIAVDASGDIYVAGATLASGFPTTAGAFDTTYNPPDPQGESDVFFVKLSPGGNGPSDLLYGTYLGGGADDYAEGLAIDAAGDAYISGATSSADFPSTTGAWDASFNGNTDAFILKLSPGGHGTSDLVYGSFLGHSDNESGDAVTVDSSGAVVVFGHTKSASFPTTPGAYDLTIAGDHDLFVTRLNSTGSELLFSTMVGGNDIEYAGTVAIARNGNVVATGGSRSGNFPTTYETAIDQTLGGYEDAVLFVLDGSGSTLVYGTYLGGLELDFGYSVTLTPSGDAVMVGRTRSSTFPITSGAAQETFGDGSCFGGQPCNDAFITRVRLSPTIFSDGFEGGDFSSWSFVFP